MNKLRTNFGIRIIAVMLAIIFGLSAIVSVAVAYFTYQMGLYTNPLSKVIKEGQENIQEINSMKIAEHLDNIEKNDWTLDNTNMEYGIVHTKKPTSQNLNNIDTFWKYHFKDTQPDSHSHSFSYVRGRDEFSYDTDLLTSLTGSDIWHDTDARKEQGLLPVTQFGYSPQDGIFYFNTENHSYPITTIGIPKEFATLKDVLKDDTDAESEVEMYPGDTYLIDMDSYEERVYFQLNSKTKEYVSASGNYKNLDTKKYNTWGKVTLDTYSAATPEIHTMTKQNLLPRDTDNITITMISPDEVHDYLNIKDYVLPAHDSPVLAAYSIAKEPESTDYYWIISNIKPMDKWVTDNDLIARQYHLLTGLYHFRYWNIALGVIFFILALLSAVFCIYSAGYRRVSENDNRTFCGKDKNILLTWRQKIPLEIYILAVCILIINCMDSIHGQLWAIDTIPRTTVSKILLVFYLGTNVCLTLGLGLMLCMHISHRIHGNIIGKYTLINSVIRKCKDAHRLIRQNISLVVKGVICLIAISFAELFAIILFYRSDALLLFWLWLKAVEIALVIVALLQMKSLQKGSEELAMGNLSHKMDTTKMFWEFKKHGENLNKIHQGLSIALEERMKSEHFKTELITNVSHDIKTPLTSIINYVDLLHKDGVTEEEKAEYLEVLDRQSKRLKKLIEDLIEASKASTGNLSVNLQPCNLDILLTQIVGEFEEKMQQENLELIINSSENAIYIQADNRHLWRIFDNLMNNICKYAQPGTRVYINQETAAGKVSIIFRNTSKDALNISGEELLERFVRGDSSRNTEGNGLGLSIAQNLTELMGGTLQIHVDGDLFKVIVTFSI